MVFPRSKSINGLKEYGTEVKVFVEINLFIKDPKTNEWSKPIFGTGGNFIVNYKG